MYVILKLLVFLWGTVYDYTFLGHGILNTCNLPYGNKNPHEITDEFIMTKPFWSFLAPFTKGSEDDSLKLFC